MKRFENKYYINNVFDNVLLEHKETLREIKFGRIDSYYFNGLLDKLRESNIEKMDIDIVYIDDPDDILGDDWRFNTNINTNETECIHKFRNEAFDILENNRIRNERRDARDPLIQWRIPARNEVLGRSSLK
jgi:hypothetical protein